MPGGEVSGVETGEGAWTACPYISLCSNHKAGKTYKMPRTPILQGCKVLELRETTTLWRDGPLAGGISHSVIPHTESWDGIRDRLVASVRDRGCERFPSLSLEKSKINRRY